MKSNDHLPSTIGSSLIAGLGIAGFVIVHYLLHALTFFFNLLSFDGDYDPYPGMFSAERRSLLLFTIGVQVIAVLIFVIPRLLARNASPPTMPPPPNIPPTAQMPTSPPNIPPTAQMPTSPPTMPPTAQIPTSPPSMPPTMPPPPPSG